MPILRLFQGIRLASGNRCAGGRTPTGDRRRAALRRAAHGADRRCRRACSGRAGATAANTPSTNSGGCARLRLRASAAATSSPSSTSASSRACRWRYCRSSPLPSPSAGGAAIASTALPPACSSSSRFNQTIDFGKNLVQADDVGPLLGLWIPFAVFTAISLYAFYRAAADGAARDDRARPATAQ